MCLILCFIMYMCVCIVMCSVLCAPPLAIPRLYYKIHVSRHVLIIIFLCVCVCVCVVGGGGGGGGVCFDIAQACKHSFVLLHLAISSSGNDPCICSEKDPSPLKETQLSIRRTHIYHNQLY